jgi:hypothetical protein
VPALRLLLAALALAVALVAAAQAAKPPVPPTAEPPVPEHVAAAERVRKGIERAVARGWADPALAAEHAAIVDRAEAALARLSGLRFEHLKGALVDVALQARALTPPRAAALFATLDLNVRHWGTSARWVSETAGPDGAVYRTFSGHGLQFHPLGTVAALNRSVAAGEVDEARRIADALLARALRAGPSLVLPYWFPYGRGEPPWSSGMAQAVGAQALAGAAELTGDARYEAAARAVFLALDRGLVRELAEGPWVRLYSFDDSPVLNAQLQAVLSLRDYGERVADAAVVELAERLERSAAALLPEFDTGAWSLYAREGAESSFGYHEYVLGLLRRLGGGEEGDPRFREAADRFEQYTAEPPVVNPGPAPVAAYPRPADGHRDAVRVRFWLSKLSRVTLHAGGAPATGTFSRGWNTIAWAPGRERAPGRYEARLSVVGPAGRRASLELPPLEIRRVQGPPAVEAAVVGRRVRWSSDDEGTPWLALRVRFRAGRSSAVVDLGRRPLAGSARLRVPPGRWGATLLAANSAGWTREVRLGTLTGPPR